MGPDAKYVAGEQRNGDAKIDIDASKKQTFNGLSKEELLKYADDPFWKRLRCCMFVLFWLVWLAMLVGAVVIIVTAPRCAAPQLKKWFEKGPLVDLVDSASFTEIEEKLPLLAKASVQGVYVPAKLLGEDIYTEDPAVERSFKKLADEAKKADLKLIVDLTANFVRKTHEWFVQSERKVAPYTDYFVWLSAPKQFDANGKQIPPNNWVSTLNEPAWSWSEERHAFYLHQYSSETPDLNLRNEQVQQELDKVLKRWIRAGASGVRLHNARQLLVDAEFHNDTQAYGGRGGGGVHTDYAYYSHARTSDQPGLAALLARCRAALAAPTHHDTVLSLSEPVPLKAPYVADNGTQLLVDLPAVSLSLAQEPAQLAAQLHKHLPLWPAVQFWSAEDGAEAGAEAGEEAGEEACAAAGLFSLLLPATPVLTWGQFAATVNSTVQLSEVYLEAVQLRASTVLLGGNESNVTALASGAVLAYNRWQAGGAGFLVLWNPGKQGTQVDAGVLKHVPDTLAVHLLSQNYPRGNLTRNSNVPSSNVWVAAGTALVFTYVPVVEA